MKNGIQNNAVMKIFTDREDYIVIGLTGKIGSGGSDVAHYLANSFEALELISPSPMGNQSFDNDSRDMRILYNFAKRHWKKFDVINVRSIITAFIIQNWDIFIKDCQDNKAIL